jgi:hypothetical protein
MAVHDGKSGGIVPLLQHAVTQNWLYQKNPIGSYFKEPIAGYCCADKFDFLNPVYS